MKKRKQHHKGKIASLVRNEKGMTAESVLAVITMFFFVVLMGLFTIDIFMQESVDAEEVDSTLVQIEPVDAYFKLEQDVFVFKGDSETMSPEEKQREGLILLGRIAELTTQAESEALTEQLANLNEQKQAVEAKLAEEVGNN